MNLKANWYPGTKSGGAGEGQRVTVVDFVTITDEYDREIVHAVFYASDGNIQTRPTKELWIIP